jgi:hypothetical protein
MTENWKPPILPSPPFWKSGAGIALIIVIGVLLIPALCIFGCLGMGVIGSVLPGATPTP